MSNKRYDKCCDKDCLRCLRNRQNYGNKSKKQLLNKFEENEKNYISIFEEFIDKYCVSTYTMDRVQEINESDFDSTEHNNNLIKKTTNAYNDWVLKEKGLDGKMKEKDLIRTMNNQYKNSKILVGNSVSIYPNGVSDSQAFYMFECIY